MFSGFIIIPLSTYYDGHNDLITLIVPQFRLKLYYFTCPFDFLEGISETELGVVGEEEVGVAMRESILGFIAQPDEKVGQM